MNIYHVGIDSTDSPKGGCTTWTAVRIMKDLINMDPDISFIGYPRLIRLNPNAPNKTRGNAAININFKSKFTLDEISQLIIKRINIDVEKFKINDNKTPGLAILVNKIPQNKLYWKAIREVITLDEAKTLQESDLLHPEDSQGLIGALASISADLKHDHTYEILAYRKSENFGKKREVNIDNIINLSNKFRSTYSSYDHKREMIAPSGPDPVFCGIRGDDPEELVLFLKQLTVKEKFENYQLYISNQGTDAHVLIPQSTIKRYNVISGEITVSSKIDILIGGHVKFESLINNRNIACMIFEPTKSLVKMAQHLLIGDRLYIHAAVNSGEHGIYLAIEFFRILDLSKNYLLKPLKCKNCDKTMTSAGKLAGYKCQKCGSKTYQTNKIIKSRQLYIGQAVYANISAQRHLTRPISRMNIRKSI